MAKIIAQHLRFAEERAHALAVVYLTRRADLIVTEEKVDSGVELRVTLNLEDKDRHRIFGVKVMGTWTAATADDANKLLRSKMKSLFMDGLFPFPVVLFFFTMDDNKGWYTWVTEPVDSSDGGFKLAQHGQADCRPLDAKAIDEIVEAVDRWYDAFFAAASRKTPVRKRN